MGKKKKKDCPSGIKACGHCENCVEDRNAQYERQNPPQSKEAVDHPQHYGGADDTYEAIKVIEAWDLGFNLGNAAKYISRAGKKGSRKEDLQKAAWYLDREINGDKDALDAVPVHVPARTPVGVAVVLRSKWGNYLFGLRAHTNKHGPGKWSLPGGWMEHGEQPHETASRELREETGIDLAPWDFAEYEPFPYTTTTFGNGIHCVTLYMHAQLPEDGPTHTWARVLERDKCERWKWCRPSELPYPLFDPIEPARLQLGTWQHRTRFVF